MHLIGFQSGIMINTYPKYLKEDEFRGTDCSRLAGVDEGAANEGGQCVAGAYRFLPAQQIRQSLITYQPSIVPIRMAGEQGDYDTDVRSRRAPASPAAANRLRGRGARWTGCYPWITNYVTSDMLPRESDTCPTRSA